MCEYSPPGNVIGMILYKDTKLICRRIPTKRLRQLSILRRPLVYVMTAGTHGVQRGKFIASWLLCKFVV